MNKNNQQPLAGTNVSTMQDRRMTAIASLPTINLNTQNSGNGHNAIATANSSAAKQ